MGAKYSSGRVFSYRTYVVKTKNNKKTKIEKQEEEEGEARKVDLLLLASSPLSSYSFF